MTRYFKITKPESVAAWEKHVDEVKAVQKAASEFAELVAPGRAKPWFSSGVRRSFAGLSFDPPMTSPEWTKPAKDTGIQRPRGKVPANVKPALVKLNELWKQAPTAVASAEPALASFGFVWGFLYGYTILKHNGALYFRTNDPQPIDGVEILGSEWEAAEAAVRQP